MLKFSRTLTLTYFSPCGHGQGRRGEDEVYMTWWPWRCLLPVLPRMLADFCCSLRWRSLSAWTPARGATACSRWAVAVLSAWQDLVSLRFDCLWTLSQYPVLCLAPDLEVHSQPMLHSPLLYHSRLPGRLALNSMSMPPMTWGRLRRTHQLSLPYCSSQLQQGWLPCGDWDLLHNGLLRDPQTRNTVQGSPCSCLSQSSNTPPFPVLAPRKWNTRYIWNFFSSP